MFDLLDRSANIGEFIPQSDDDLIICRCEEITKGEIRKAVHMGMWTLTELKRLIRPGMGLCQGQTCQMHVKRIVAAELKCDPREVREIIVRPPVRPVEALTYLNEAAGE